MSISAAGPRTHRGRHPRRRGEDVGRDRLRAGADVRPTPTALPILLAAVGALALPWLLVAFTAMPVHRILSLQIVAVRGAAAVLLPAARCASR